MGILIYLFMLLIQFLVTLVSLFREIGFRVEIRGAVTPRTQNEMERAWKMRWKLGVYSGLWGFGLETT